MLFRSHLTISGGDFGGSEKFPQFVEAAVQQGIKAGLSKEEAKHIAAFYGSNAPTVFDLVSERKAEAEKFNLPLVTFAKLVYGIEHELIATLVDFYFRRTGDLLFDIASVHQTRKAVSRYMAECFNWSEVEKARYEAELDEEIQQATTPAV